MQKKKQDFFEDFLFRYCDLKEEIWHTEEFEKDRYSKWESCKVKEAKDKKQITPPSNILVFEIEIKNNREKQNQLNEDFSQWLLKEDYTYACVFSGNQSFHFWILLEEEAKNTQIRKNIIKWLREENKLKEDWVDAGSSVLKHAWVVPGIKRVSKPKETALVKVNHGKPIPLTFEMKKNVFVDPIDISKLLNSEVMEGKRDLSAFWLATWYRKRGLDEQSTLLEMRDWNAKKLNPPLQEKQLSEKVRSAFKPSQPYHYPFINEPKKEEDVWESELIDLFTPNDKGHINMKLVRAHIVSWLLSEKYFVMKKQGEEREHLYWYHEGKYLRNGAEKIKEWVNSKLEKIGEGHQLSKAMLTEIIHTVGVKTYIEEEEFNHPDFLNLRNGVLDLRELELHPHNPDLCFTYKLGYDYDPEAKCPIFMEFLEKSALQKEIPIIQTMFGYCLHSGVEYQKWFMLYGKGSNGKSVLLDVLSAMLGEENVSGVTLQKLVDNRFAYARLKGKRANISSEVGCEMIKDTSVLKGLVSGDAMFAENKGVDGFNMKNSAKLIYSANILPKMSEYSDGNMRRIVLLHFTKDINEEDRDVLLTSKIVNNELSGVLNWAIKGLVQLKYSEQFKGVVSIEQTREEWEKLSNPYELFVEEYISEGDPDNIIPVFDLWQIYRNYCETVLKMTPPKRNEFSKMMRETLRDAEMFWGVSRNPYGFSGLKLRRIV